MILLSRELTPEEYRIVAKNFIASLGDFAKYIESNASVMPNNAMFLPIRTNKEYVPFSKVVEGEAINIEEFLVESEEEDKVVKKKLAIDDAEVLGFLDKLDVKKCNYNKWLKVGMGLHFQYDGKPKGYDMWLNWSLKDSRYEADKVRTDCEYRWKSLKVSGGNYAVTFASVISMINDSGAKRSAVSYFLDETDNKATAS